MYRHLKIISSCGQLRYETTKGERLPALIRRHENLLVQVPWPLLYL